MTYETLVIFFISEKGRKKVPNPFFPIQVGIAVVYACDNKKAAR
jgi:hypothetical protein